MSSVLPGEAGYYIPDQTLAHLTVKELNKRVSQVSHHYSLASSVSACFMFNVRFVPTLYINSVCFCMSSSIYLVFSTDKFCHTPMIYFDSSTGKLRILCP